MVNYLSQVQAIPKEISSKIDDLSDYEKTRDGITNRF